MIIWLIAGNSLEPIVPKCKNLLDWTISSEALSKRERSTTIPSGSRSQETSKRQTPRTGEDIVCSVWKHAESLRNR